MASIFSRKMDLSNIMLEIDRIYCKENKDPKYIIMSEDTLKEIRDSILVFNDDKDDEKVVSEIFGKKVAVCNAISFGEFEVVA